METMTIGQLAAAGGVNLETVRYYERRGLLAAPPRTAAGYRQYSAGDLWRLQLIGRAKRLGFTLAEIDELLGEDRTGTDRDSATERVLAAAQAKIAAVDDAMQALADQRTRLAQLVGVCADGPAADCTALRLIG